MLRLICVLVAVLSLALAPAAGAAPKLHTLVNYHQTGGFAGVDIHVVVHTNATASIAKRGARTVHRRLSTATMSRLRRALDAAHVEDPVHVGPAGCADCFEYSIGYGGHHAEFSDVNIPARYGPALAQLQKIAGR